MKKILLVSAALAVCASVAWGLEMKTVHGTISKIDSAGKTAVIKTADGTEHAVKFVGKTTVHGTEAGAKNSFHGLKEGSEVVARYSEEGGKQTAVEVDRVGEGGLQVTQGTVSEVDKGAKKIAVTTADGTRQTFEMTGHASEDVGKGVEKSAKVSVYYTQVGAKKVAHVLFGN